MKNLWSTWQTYETTVLHLEWAIKARTRYGDTAEFLEMANTLKENAPSLSRPDFPTLCTSGAYLQMLQIELHVATKTAEILESIKALCQTSAHRRKW